VLKHKEPEGITSAAAWSFQSHSNHVLELVEHASPKCLLHLFHMLWALTKYNGFCQFDMRGSSFLTHDLEINLSTWKYIEHP